MLLALPTPSEMALWDRETIDTIGIPGITLMESASREAVTALIEEYGPVDDREIYCFAGSGNNGGDAFAMARHLADLGADVTVFHTRPKKKYRGEVRTNLLWAQKLDIPLVHLASVDPATLSQPDIVIDGLLGTGFDGDLREDTLELVRSINRLGKHAFILSVDIPSGLSGLTGQPQPEAVMADVTATFQVPKLGLIMPEAQKFTGRIHVCPIGIPMKVQDRLPVKHHLITGDILHSIPAPTPAMHKGKAGHVLILGGSEGLTGAPHLAAMGALRAGAGLVTIACPGGLADSVKSGSPDIMTMPLETGTKWSSSMMEILLPHLRRFDAVVVGPGMGRSSNTPVFILSVVAEQAIPMVLDADALHGLARFPKVVNELREHAVLTPHPGEMAMLLNTDTASIQADRLGAVDRFTDRSSATLVLKGAGTLVARPGMTCISPFSEPNLAVGGSGDVLSGIIGSLLARGISPMEAACLGVFWHGMAGRALREKFPDRGNLASEIADMLPLMTPSNEE